MKKIIIGAVVIVVLIIAYWLLSPLWIVKYANDSVPAVQQQSTTSSTTTTNVVTTNLSGVFVNGVHNVSGTVRIIDSANGTVLRFENFKTLNGPDLHIYLASDNTAKDFVEVGLMKATEGNSNYIVPPGTDVMKYNHVLVWCKTFRVLFGSAELK